MPRTYKPRSWPYKAASQRDNAAEEINAALKSLVALLALQTEPETIRAFALAIFRLQNALRNLEAAGAPTRPAPQI